MINDDNDEKAKKYSIEKLRDGRISSPGRIIYV